MGSGSIGRELDLDVLVNEIRGALRDSLEVNFTGDGIVTLRLNEGGPAFTVDIRLRQRDRDEEIVAHLGIEVVEQPRPVVTGPCKVLT
ncbi:hypothetical protein [Natrinema sp. 74]|uniref:hypothetical protein n=1 Tax=Natrinema sp. 74 TaxID=3384159 RepID=UPI0038D4D88B